MSRTILSSLPRTVVMWFGNCFVQLTLGPVASVAGVSLNIFTWSFTWRVWWWTGRYFCLIDLFLHTECCWWSHFTSLLYFTSTLAVRTTAVVNNYRTKDHFAPLLSFDLSNVAIKLYSWILKFRKVVRLHTWSRVVDIVSAYSALHPRVPECNVLLSSLRRIKDFHRCGYVRASCSSCMHEAFTSAGLAS